ncbi:MAG: NADH-quinone oxidoreductase subunit NuoH [Planctomycetota bacterium]
MTPQFIASVLVIFTVLNVFLGASAYLILLERRVAAWVQDRCGPNRVGPMGLLQPIADGLKLFMKEDFLPKGADLPLFIMAPAITAFMAMIGLAVIPWGGTLDLSTLPFADLIGITSLSAEEQVVKVMGADVHIGIIYLVAVASLSVYGVVLGGWASNNKFSFLGALRASAQMVSYEIPMGVALLCVILTAGTIRPDLIVGGQLDGQWNIIHQPIAALLFYVCMLAEAGRAPFDLAEAEAELVGGWHTEYSSMKWALFFLGEYIGLLVSAGFFAVLFLGGWSLNPFTGADLPAGGGIGLVLLQIGIMFGKVFAIVFFTMMVRWTLPRLRFDQLMRLAWEGMIPASLVMLLVTSFFVYMGWTNVMWAGAIGTGVFIWIVLPFIPRQISPNHRLPMIGSRFSPLDEGGGDAGDVEQAVSVSR